MHFTLRVGPDWASQIQRIRNAVSEDTNLIRFDNTFYRVCKTSDPAPAFGLTLLPSVGAESGLVLRMHMNDLYVETIDAQPFTRYASTLSSWLPADITLDNAIRGLLRKDQRVLQGDRRFVMQSLVVLCVAESLRFDRIATEFEQAFRSMNGMLRGVPPRLKLQSWEDMAKKWGQTSERIFAALSDEARTIALKERALLSQQERRFSERVSTASLGDEYADIASNIRLLKRPKGTPPGGLCRTKSG
ncbi:hypothetical protein [Burkholderia ubonensis]|uniref:hypothetical protein n=1 Tax=Burkholderia ubonensis TaxID=101571 RepID=UPI00075E0704|nr:hypothetical protein [Burkholderia ubonensis]KVS39254.1 hypothetical protein WK38_03750 [Burkholderia ubonensis]KVS46168.1 hypothetical protein WK37_11560 [Burkholderia ubonensis]KVS78846.1 hypothetical protein WK42_15440 [Burkholderia ubonensis]KVS80614.1 hypothetical protein WK44_29405 [Burkholderia ubonensis]KVS85608.1 hypothetical protein WK43_21945 [Burkholderia ubonensis]